MNHQPVSAPSAPASAGSSAPRLLSLDTYRGLIMISLAFAGFGLAETATRHLKDDPDSRFWQGTKYQFSHAEWVGCSYWDLIQPSFMFMVGVSMAYSYAKRRQLGDSYGRMLGHAVLRSFVLVFLGIFLISNGDTSTSWSLMNVLTQIGLGYTLLFLLWGRSTRTQGLAAVVILAGTWLAYELGAGAGISPVSGTDEAGVTAAWAQENLAGVGRAWHKNANVGHRVDLWLLNLLPRKEPFQFSQGGYQTINFIPSLATMLFGLMCGELLRSGGSAGRKVLLLAVAGLGGLAVGHLLDSSGLCPLVKRIWTPSWTLFSTGWCCLILAALFGVVDVLNFRRWTFPLVVAGMNSIALYSMSMLLKPWTARTLKTHLGDEIFRLKVQLGEQIHYLADPACEPMVKAILVGLMFWLACYWMYRQKIFIRI
jgi:heparan-alpha-glucosaminide N-acetyltransferase